MARLPKGELIRKSVVEVVYSSISPQVKPMQLPEYARSFAKTALGAVGFLAAILGIYDVLESRGWLRQITSSPAGLMSSGIPFALLVVATALPAFVLSYWLVARATHQRRRNWPAILALASTHTWMLLAGPLNLPLWFEMPSNVQASPRVAVAALAISSGGFLVMTFMLGLLRAAELRWPRLAARSPGIVPNRRPASGGKP